MVWFRRYCHASVSCTVLSLIICSPTVLAQQISTNTPVPPLQWINLTHYLTGSSPPPVKDASIGYYDATQKLIIFGGESAQGNPQSSTYILDLQSLEWSEPETSQSSPSARSAAISGDDIAASYRNAHIVIGGLGSDGEVLSDIWEYDYDYNIWTQVQVSPGGPGPRYGAIGGSDTRTPPMSSPVSSTSNNSFYLAGGINGSSVSPLSDIWRLNVTGTLSPNNLQDVYASWEQVPISTPHTPSKVGAAGAVVSQGVTQMIAAIGGCTSSSPDATCAQIDSYMINTEAGTVGTSNACPAPRLGGTVVANFNTLDGSTVFNSQVFLVLGLINNTLWSDQGGLEKGEVDVLNIDTGEWARILPAGDPGPTGGTPSYPSPRQGAVGVSYGQTMVGSQTERNIASDTIIFGGVDADGNYLSEVWILRAYNAQLTQSGQQWSGFGDGSLVGGLNATGQGVTVQYMTECASALSPKATQTSSVTAVPTTTATSPGAPASTSPASSPSYDTAATHRALSPISVALVMPAVILARISSPIGGSGHGSMLAFFSAAVLGLAAYGVGIAGLATSFTSITTTVMSPISKRSTSSSDILKTAHGRAGLALFIAFYGLLPLLYVFSGCFFRSSQGAHQNGLSDRGDVRRRANSSVAAEKEGLFSSRVASPARRSADGSTPDRTPTDPRPRVRSWGGIGSLGVSGRRSSESGADAVITSPSPSSHRSFEVTNRPVRVRRASGNSLAAFSDPRPSGTPRNLSDLSWFDRRRSLNTVGELDYALGQLGPRDPSNAGTLVMDIASTSGLMTSPHQAFPEMPNLFDFFLHTLFHLLFLGLCVLTLAALWMRAPKAAFIVFLIGTVAFYIILISLSWYGKPRRSVLTVFFSRLRGDPGPVAAPSTPVPSRPLSTVGSEVPFPVATEQRSPYQHHHPPFRTTMSVGLDEYPASTSHDHGTTDMDDDDDEDEATRQRRIEEELSRRDVSIVTVPKRRLFLTNPEQLS